MIGDGRDRDGDGRIGQTVRGMDRERLNGDRKETGPEPERDGNMA